MIKILLKNAFKTILLHKISAFAIGCARIAIYSIIILSKHSYQSTRGKLYQNRKLYSVISWCRCSFSSSFIWFLTLAVSHQLVIIIFHIMEPLPFTIAAIMYLSCSFIHPSCMHCIMTYTFSFHGIWFMRHTTPANF